MNVLVAEGVLIVHVMINTQGLEALGQWVSEVLNFSSQSLNPKNYAVKIIGEMDGFQNGDNAWLQETIDAKQFIEIKVASPVKIEAITICELINPGGVKQISARNPTGFWDMMYQTNSVEVLPGFRLFAPELQKNIPYLTDTFRLDIDCTAATAAVGIDCVWIVGSTTPDTTMLITTPTEDSTTRTDVTTSTSTANSITNKDTTMYTSTADSITGLDTTTPTSIADDITSISTTTSTSTADTFTSMGTTTPTPVADSITSTDTTTSASTTDSVTSKDMTKSALAADSTTSTGVITSTSTADSITIIDTTSSPSIRNSITGTDATLMPVSARSSNLYKPLKPVPYKTSCKIEHGARCDGEYKNKCGGVERAEIIDAIITELKIERTNSSLYRRTKISVDDDRLSCAVLGGISVAIIISIFGLLLISDLLNLFKQGDEILQENAKTPNFQQRPS